MIRQPCPSPEVLRAFTNGDLSETRLDGLGEHLESCPDCERQLARLDGLADTVVLELRARLPASTGALTAEGQSPTGAALIPLDSAVTVPTHMDDFRIIHEIGRGGMGVVYEAFQCSLNRHVAIKMLPKRGDVTRFRREAKAAGRLHHTNIVPVFGIGEHEGRHYYVMQYIEGRGLDALLKERRAAARGGALVAPDNREVARIGFQAAEALAYAHTQGVIHRDIKPSNILLDAAGTVWVTDFGLALDMNDPEGLTHTGDFLGTLRYLAPERISGRGDARADIYGLGVSLYELICGRPAFEESDRAVLLEQVLHQAPPSPRQFDQRVARDVETIVLKAMARDPAHRYASASDLAADLRRFLEDRPIWARRVSTVERAVHWSRRNPWLAGAICSTFAALALVAALAALYANQKVRIVNQQTRIANEQAKARVEIDGLNVELTKRGDDLEKSLARANLNLAMFHFERGREACERGDIGPGLLSLVECWRSAIAAGNLGTAWRHIARTSLSAWQRLHPELEAVFSHAEGVIGVAVSPDGKTVLTGCKDNTARLWDCATGQPIGASLTHRGMVQAVAFSPDGKTVVTGSWDGTARIWNATTGQPLGQPIRHPGPVQAVAFRPDGKAMLTGCQDYKARIWDLATGRLIGQALLHPSPVAAVAFSPDGKTLLTGCWTGTAHLWDALTGQPLGQPLIHPGPVQALAISPDGKSVLTGSEDTRRGSGTLRRVSRPASS